MKKYRASSPLPPDTAECRRPKRRFLSRVAFSLASLLLLPFAAKAQLPTPTYGWNLGNTLEAIPSEGSWGPAATQNLINTVAAAGFNTVRIPCAWDTHANQSTLQIDPTWMARVKQVVDWCYAKNLYVVLNCHWDGGWLDNNIGDTPNPTVTQKMNSYWTQIANTFVGYDNHLMFAGANEPPADTAAQVATLMNYYQTFINAVRATGGNNATRWLVIQGPHTNIDQTYDMVNTLPSDSATGRLMVEVHHYPYQWTLMTQDETWGKMFYFWGQGYHSPTMLDRNSTWGEEAYTDDQFGKMATKFVSKGIPVIVGEWGAVKRTGYPDLTGTELNRHLASRTYFSKTITDKANALGLKPMWWDAGGTGSNTMWLFDRSTAAVIDPDNLRALTGGAALPPPAACTATTVSVASISIAAVGQGKKRGQATVTVVNNCGVPVAGATVTGNFSGTISQSGVSAVTNSSGVAVLQTSASVRGTVTVTFCVSGIVKSGLTYSASSNVETCDNN
jgi:aryl-phospho-beta-D-glucosidase BglC (GH1 family)